jgi:hypothetical protein
MVSSADRWAAWPQFDARVGRPMGSSAGVDLAPWPQLGLSRRRARGTFLFPHKSPNSDFIEIGAAKRYRGVDFQVEVWLFCSLQRTINL